jgi:hypothetical protein
MRGSTRRIVFFVVGFAACLAISTLADARKVAENSGDFLATAGATVRQPSSLSMGIETASRPQTVQGTWGVKCLDERTHKWKGRRGAFTGTSPIRQRLSIPVRHPEKCKVNAAGSQDLAAVPPPTTTVVTVRLYAGRS